MAAAVMSVGDGETGTSRREAPSNVKDFRREVASLYRCCVLSNCVEEQIAVPAFRQYRNDIMRRIERLKGRLLVADP